MLKSIGSLHNVPGPSSDVLSESLKLLTTFGDKKAISALLEQMRDIQAHNEKVFKDTQAAIETLSIERKEFEESRKTFSNEMAEKGISIQGRMDALSQSEARLSGEKARFSKEKSEANSALAEKEAAIATRERQIVARESKCDEREKDLDSRLAVLSNKESNLREREQQLQAKEKKLRAVLDGV